jgi:fatty acid desaturase
VTRSPIEHLTPDELEAIGAELDTIRDEVMADVGEQDADYIRKVIKTQRTLEVGGRAALLVSLFPPAWLLGTAALSVAKILENMEIGHNVMHGQWDWMRDPEIHSSTWEWDNVSSAESWKHSHNFQHHMFAAFFEWGVALHDLELDEARRGRKPWSAVGHDVKRLARKAGKQVVKDYLVWPALSGPSAVPALFGSLGANLVRNVWSHAIIFCGHFPDGAETFDCTEDQLDGETRGDWYVRQLLGSANLDGARLFHIMAGNLSFQIEHHLFPDVPSNRYQEIAPRVREVCERHGLPYTSGPLYRQYAQVLIKIARYALPGGGPSEASEPRDVEASPPAPGERALKAVAA